MSWTEGILTYGYTAKIGDLRRTKWIAIATNASIMTNCHCTIGKMNYLYVNAIEKNTSQYIVQKRRTKMITPQETQKIFNEFRRYCRMQRRPIPFIDWLYRKKKITIDELIIEEEE